MSDAGAMSSGFRPWCHLEFVPAVLLSKWMRRRTTRPFDGIIADAARPSLIETLTSGRSVVYNNIDKDAAPTSRRFQSGGPARSRCAPSASAERARRGLWRHGGVLRPSRPRTGQVRDAPTTLGRGAGGEPRGRRLRHQPTSVLYGRSGFPGAGNSWPTAASTGAAAQSQMHRRGTRLCRAVAKRAWYPGTGEPAGGGPAPLRGDDSPPLPQPSAGTAQKKTHDHDRARLSLTPRLADAGYLLEQYEALRREALAAGWIGERGHGLAMFLARGMSAWVAAVKALVPSKRRELTAEDSAQHALPIPPHSLRAELTTVLAGMVLACSGGEGS